jgi:hypothetical protein
VVGYYVEMQVGLGRLDAPTSGSARAHVALMGHFFAVTCDLGCFGLAEALNSDYEGARSRGTSTQGEPGAGERVSCPKR